MQRSFRIFIPWILLTVTATAIAQTPPLTLDRLVPLDRQKQLGFDTLSPQQRAEIVRLLKEVYNLGLQEGKKGVAASPSKGTTGTESPSVIETQINGDFEGWEGETIVKLMNGQIWQQSEYYYHYHYAFMPKVLVYRSGSGYKMKVDGVDKAVGVARLR